MAILKDIKVVISVNGQELKEYEDEDAINEDGSSVSKYVEATSGAEFQVVTSAPISYQFSSDALAIKIYLDGVYVENGLVLKEHVRGLCAWQWQRTFHGAKSFDGNRWELKPFKFVEIKAVENDSQRADNTSRSSHVKDLGTVNVELHRRMVLGKRAPKIWETDKDIGSASVHTEKQLKGKSVTHGVAFGDARKTDDVTTYDTIYVDGKDSPIAKFTFKYCSRKALQDLLLIPRTPTPLPLEERNIDDLSPEEMRELLRKQQVALSMKNDIGIKREETKAERGTKREHDEEYDELMRSAITKKVKTRAFEHGETIELD